LHVFECAAAFNLDFYTDVQDLSYLQDQLDQDPRAAKYRSIFLESISWIIQTTYAWCIECVSFTLPAILPFCFLST
jgi:hypothetical protein